MTGLFLALVAGRFLQSRRDVVPWYSLARLLVISCYALTGLFTFILSKEYAVIATLAIWAFATLPQTVLAVAFSVVMNAVAGPEGRYALLPPALGNLWPHQCGDDFLCHTHDRFAGFSAKL